MQPTLADRNNNPGNIRDINTGNFKNFNTPQEGFAELMNDLETKKTGRSRTGLKPESSLAEFAGKYAPSSDNNNVAQYTANLANHLGVRPDTPIKDLDTGAWAEAIAKAEGYTPAKSYQPRQPKDQGQSQRHVQEQPAQQPQEEGGTPFKYNAGDSGMTAGLKALGNTPQAALNFGKGVVSTLNPVNTLNTLSQIPEQASGLVKDKGLLGAIGSTLKEIPSQAYKTLVPEGIRKIIGGDVQGAAKSFTEDPFGQSAPLVFAAQGGAKALDKSASKTAMKGYVENIGENVKNRVPIPKPTTAASDLFNKGVEKTAGLITKPVGEVLGKVGDVVKHTTGSLISKFTGMNPETITQVISNPKEFSKMAREETSRGDLANEVKDAIDTRINDLQETGKGYDAVKKSGEVANTGFISDEKGIRPLFIDDALKANGLELRNGKVQATTESVTRNSSDINALNKFYKDWGTKKTFTPNEFLNMRSDLAELAKYDKVTGMGKTRSIEKIAADMRAKANDTIRPQLTGLKELDDTYAPEVQFLKQVRKDFVDSNGNLKDNAPSRIANSPNKAELTKRLEQLIPDIGKRIDILKAAEDIERASGIKVGAYGTMAPAAIGLLTGGPVGAILAQIIASPENAVAIIRQTGNINKSVIAPVIKILKLLGGDIGNKSLKSITQAGLISDNAKVNQ